jgi:hypothetical protein
MIQCKAGCACGGGCPDCREEAEDLSVQTKLAVSTPGDPFEEEADRVAEQVTRMPAPSDQGKWTAVSGTSLLGLGSGAPLDAATRTYFEPRFGADFGNVRVYADDRAAASAGAVSARAYTLGTSIVFGRGEFRPQTDGGRSLLAHELTHVVQQSRDTRGAGRIQRACGPAAVGTPAGCTPVSGNVVGERFLFARSCDSFLVPEEQARLELFADTIADGETVAIHGYASTDGDPAFNERLSCARALKAQFIIQSILTGKGVSAVVNVFMHGESAGLNPVEQRSVVVDKSGVTPPSPPPPTPLPPAPLPPAPAPALSSCNLAQTTMVSGHTVDARVWVDNAVPRIHAFAAGTASAAEAAIVSAALTANFHTTAPADVATIATNFDDLRTELGTAFAVECVSTTWCDPTDLAYVRGRFAVIRRLGDVNLCPLWFTCLDYFTRVGAIIHEIAHQHPGATDNAYEWNPAYASLSSSDAMDNAESYAVTARQIYHMGGHGPGTGGTC